MIRLFWLAVALAGALLLAFVGVSSPEPSVKPVGDREFSTMRAKPDLDRIAREPHAVTTAANKRVRDYLFIRMGELGLKPSIQAASAFNARGEFIGGAEVENLIGVLPGKDRGQQALVLMAHYDSVPGSPGAGDDASGVAVILETVRALKAMGTPERDVVVLFTDGEEVGLVGAHAFFADHPLARRAGAVINLEARGGGGRAAMFETGDANGALIGAFADGAKTPFSSSLIVFLYRAMPNDTDFTVPRKAGIAGLNYAFVGRQFDYHSPTATVANLNLASVQSMGEQTLAAAQTLAFGKALPAKAPDAVYSHTFGDTIIAYPAWVGWILLLAIGGLLVFAGWRARRAGEALRLADGLRGAGSGVAAILLAILLLSLLRLITGYDYGYMEERPLWAQAPLWETAQILAGLAVLLAAPILPTGRIGRIALALAALIAGGLTGSLGDLDLLGWGLGIVAAVLIFFRLAQPADRAGGWAGLLLFGWIAAALLQLFLPLAGFILAWPLAAGALAAAASRYGAAPRLGGLIALIGAVTLGWLGGYAHFTIESVGWPPLLALTVFLGLFSLWPLLHPGEDRRWALAPAGAALLAAIVAFAFIPLGSPWTARHPEATTLMHVTDASNGKAWLAASWQTPWASKAMGGGDIGEASFPPWAREPVAAKPVAAPPQPVARPTLAQEKLPDGRIQLTLTPPPGALVIRLDFEPNVDLPGFTLQGRPVGPVKKGDWRRINWTTDGRPLVIAFRPPGPGAAEVHFSSIVPGWPTGVPAPPPRKPTEMAWGLSNSTIVVDRRIVRW